MSAKLQSAKSETTEDIIDLELIHITLGVKNSCSKCPIANAIRSKYFHALVMEERVWLTSNFCDNYTMSDMLKAIIHTFDKTGLMDTGKILINHKDKTICLKT